MTDAKKGLPLNVKVYRGCPCLLQDEHETYCLNEKDFLEVVLIQIEEGVPPAVGERGICYNMVIAGEDGYLHCSSTRNHIKIKGELIPNEFFEETYNLARLAFTDPTSCTQCLYNLLSSNFSKKKLAIFILGNEKPMIEAYKKKLIDKLKNIIPKGEILIAGGMLKAASPQVILKKGRSTSCFPINIGLDELEKSILRLLNEETDSK